MTHDDRRRGDRRGDRGRRPHDRDRRRSRGTDPRRVALGVLEEVEAHDAYANLLLPARLAEADLSPRDRAFATELVYGTIRWQRLYDELIGRAARRDPDRLARRVRWILRLGAHQALHMRVPGHAAVNETVRLARQTREDRAAGLVNAVMHRLVDRDPADWDAELRRDLPADRYLSVRWSHPEWIVRALRRALAADGRLPGDDARELEALLAADDAAPVVNLVALPGIADRDTIPGAESGTVSPFGALLAHGDPADVCGHGVRVQDAGSQVAALALAAAPGDVPATASAATAADRDAAGPGPAADQTCGATASERWIDVCAGPGGKTALLAALAARRQPDASVAANEPVLHRAQLVRDALAEAGFADVPVAEGDGVTALAAGEWDRALIDAPCTGLGALRRRPESRWRKTPADLATLTGLQRRLLDAAVAGAHPGALIAYITCSPHVAETRRQIEGVLERHPGALEVLDTAAVLADAGADLAAAAAGTGFAPVGTGAPGLQLWPHVHGTDAMFISLLRRRA